ncbi:MAG TPA: type II toxin-antitoxin system VapC family toxin [Solirubrobacteraceae bacterium]|nr:type II toxin-antitoxin system VapC family toxin [Solirubrobacteraceae bacterium]
MRRVFLDANVFLYAVGTAQRERDVCRGVLELAVDGQLEGETSVEVVQEVAHVRARRLGLVDAVARGRWALALGLSVHAVEARDLERAFDLLEQVAGGHIRDALHAATALNRGVTSILSADRAFDAFPGVRRVDPTDGEAVEALLRT